MIEFGKRYMLRNGEISRPIICIELALVTDGERVWGIDGNWSSKGPNGLDLLLEHPITAH